MCIAVFLWQSHPLYPFLLFLNRDEYHNRETSSIPDAKTRGDLPLRYLQSQKSPAEFAQEIEKEVSLYNGFNLVVAHVFSKSMFYITNRGGDKIVSLVSPGIHVLSNANLDSPWPKSLRLRDAFNQLLTQHQDREFPVKTMVEEVMTDTVKDQEPELPHVFSPETEYHLSSIFVDIPRPAGRYGTRSISSLSIKSQGEVCFYEKHLQQGGSWKEHTQHFVIQNPKT
ncbi:hypothetical protein Bca4012_015889 [Brassica carinata]